MTAPLTWTVDSRPGGVVVTVRGTLVLRDTPALRSELLKQLADQPAALLVDLSGMTAGEATALAVFTAVTRQAARWPGVPVVLCGPTGRASEMISRGRFGKLTVQPDVETAFAALLEGQVAKLAVNDLLLPVPGAARHARNLVTDACLSWDRPELVGLASLVASEFVANAVEHAGTMMTVQVSRRFRYVQVAVRDGSPEKPRLIAPDPPTTGRGRGLVLVTHLAVHWGSLPTADGKVVWASLAA